MAVHTVSVHSKVSTILLMVVPYLRFAIFLAANFNKNFDLQDYNEKKLDITFELPYPTPLCKLIRGSPLMDFPFLVYSELWERVNARPMAPDILWLRQ